MTIRSNSFWVKMVSVHILSESSRVQRFFIISEFFKVLPVEVIEHVLSFCDGKDLIQVSETCTKFKGIVPRNSKLISKLRLVIDFTEHSDNLEDVGQCLDSRNYSALTIRNLHPMTDECMNKTLSKMISMTDKFSKIEHLTLNLDVCTQKNFKKLLGIFFRTLKSCYLQQVKLSVNSLPDKYEVDGLGCDSLEALTLARFDPFFCDDFFRCKNLKRLTFAEHRLPLIPGPFMNHGMSLWKIANFKLEKLELLYQSSQLKLSMSF